MLLDHVLSPGPFEGFLSMIHDDLHSFRAQTRYYDYIRGATDVRSDLIVLCDNWLAFARCIELIQSNFSCHLAPAYRLRSHLKTSLRGWSQERQQPRG